MMGHLPSHLALVILDDRIRGAHRRSTLTGQRQRTARTSLHPSR